MQEITEETINRIEAEYAKWGEFLNKGGKLRIMQILAKLSSRTEGRDLFRVGPRDSWFSLRTVQITGAKVDTRLPCGLSLPQSYS